jgi:hypothetical protein
MIRNKLLLIGFFAFAIAAAQWLPREAAERAEVERGVNLNAQEQASGTPADALQRAFLARASNVQVEGEGVVTKVLADDNDGSRHQRFILALASGQTLLIAHNIDLAPRLDALREGDTVRFFGEYEWNNKGGVLHWTHRDPAGRHPGGWLEYGGRRYE